MTEKKFQKKVEDFICERCGHKVEGTGFTNHCPQCFYSKHVDINPGDRKESCGGLMKVVEISSKDGKYILNYQCLKCDYTKKNKLQREDNMDNLIKLQNEINDSIVKR